ncbi:hypothetical protein [Actinokineospora sp. HUAS TT18]|uniref:hypothetical protein n=1 Tax=Actinokineospora sp. HUAS TT18 TaxID=3447451 RepID=UPI003F524E06
MTYAGVRFGSFAVIDGTTYPVIFAPNSERVVLRVAQADNPDPARYTWAEFYKAWVTEIPLSQCERVYQAQSYGTWRGGLVAIEAVTPEGLRVRSAGNDGGWAEANDFVQENKYEFFRVVPARELVDVHEIQTDLLFAREHANDSFRGQS